MFTKTGLILNRVVTSYLFFHSVMHVSIAFISIPVILGFTPLIIFQLAHTIEGNMFPRPDADKGNIQNEWAIYQAETIANFVQVTN